MRKFIEAYRPTFERYLDAEHSVGYWPGRVAHELPIENAYSGSDYPPLNIQSIHGSMRMRDVFMRILEESGEMLERQAGTDEQWKEMADILLYISNACIWAGHAPGEHTELWRMLRPHANTDAAMASAEHSVLIFHRSVINCSRLCAWLPHRVARKSDQLVWNFHEFGKAMDVMIKVFFIMGGRLGVEGEELRYVAQAKIAENEERLAQTNGVLAPRPPTTDTDGDPSSERDGLGSVGADSAGVE